jgi:hypothetical protein
MDSVTFWKNFNLGTEVQLSGTFIYNGLQNLDQIRDFHNEEDVFEFLYNIAVGVERLEKVAIILIEHDSTIDQELFEESLITHNHSELLRRIKERYPSLDFHSVHNEFMQLLSKFYKSYRYDRYSLVQIASGGKEKEAIEKFLMKYLGDEIKDGEESGFIRNSRRIKSFIGKTVGKIATELYEVICKEAGNKNIYTYEIRVDSKAYKIFMRKEFDFYKESVLSKELLVYLMRTDNVSGIIKFIKEIDPLEFDSGLLSEYLQSFQNDLRKLEHLDEVDALYENVENKGERLKMLDVIGNPYIHFDDDFEEE